MTESDLTYVQRKLGSGMFVQSRIVEIAGVSLSTLHRIMFDKTTPKPETVSKLKQYFIDAGK